ncbi:MAG TPA: hypothetical protein DDZ41_05755, partial [Flavobacterium sp.]|nr:hypothetical protein [Flavobacterium sp.]
LKPISIPRLELMAALLGARLSVSIKRSINLQINSVHLWSDSKIVLHWIRSSSKRYKTFVAQRIGEIHDLTDPCFWNYVPTKLNIADDATKIKSINFSSDSVWFKGPEFLTKTCSEWPRSDLCHENFETVSIDNDEELKNEFLNIINAKNNDFNSIVPDVSRFSKWTPFVRTMAWILRAVELFKSCKSRIVTNGNTSFELKPEEIIKAENVIWQKIQSDSFSLEIELFQNGQPLPKSSSLYSFSIFLSDDNMLRIKGRLSNTNYLFPESKTPIILSHKHAITKLLVTYFHEKNNHIGTETIISDVRKKFWITRLRSIVKKCSYECQYCRNIKAKPQIPVMGQLPSCRVEQVVRPFINCGVVYFGPIGIPVGRRHEKRYGV